MRPRRIVVTVFTALGLGLGTIAMGTGTSAAGGAEITPPTPGGKPVDGPHFANATAFDVSAPLSRLAADRTTPPVDVDALGHGPDGADVVGGPPAGLPASAAVPAAASTAASASIPATNANFEGLSNQDNFDVFGFRVNPPDPVGDVGPNHYVEMTNLVFGVYDKTGNLLLGPVDTGTLWDGFAVPDCTDPSGDPIVVYDQFADRWLLSQFTTSGLSDPSRPFWNCVAISTTGDPTGSYYRYAFETENFQYFPDYPKYGIWKDSYVITTREFGPTVEYGIGVYAIDRNKMIEGQPAQVVSFFVDGNDPTLLPLVGDGLLPADVDGATKPKQNVPIPIIGTQDDGAFYGATSDAVNVWELDVKWNAKAASEATFELAAQLPVDPFDSIFPCAPTSRDCLAQPGVTNATQYLDVQSYRQRPLWRNAWRSFRSYDSMVTSQAVEAAPGVAGMRWYEIRRNGDGAYSIAQQGTYAPGDGVNRWMGSIAQDGAGNMALGYSVVNGTDVYPGIRYTGRLSGDTAGQMTLGEGTIVDGSGVQLTTNSRWGDYSSMNVDPTDDCTFWYVNEYYTAEGQASSVAGWQTRIASFRLPGC